MTPALKLEKLFNFMRFKVFLKKNHKEFEEIVIANNKKDAIQVALKNNPNSEVVYSDWTFKC